MKNMKKCFAGQQDFAKECRIYSIGKNQQVCRLRSALNREDRCKSGAVPLRKGKFTAICHWETGKAQLNVEPEPGDLPVTGILHLREIGGYLHRLFIYALSREGIFILKGGLRMCKEMILVTGGARSGKSEFAERFVLHYGSKCAYIATAEIFDDEMAERVRLHQERRLPKDGIIMKHLMLPNR